MMKKNLFSFFFLLTFLQTSIGQFKFSEGLLLDECQYCDYRYDDITDVEGDGDIDIWVYDPILAKAILFKNNGQGDFIEVASNLDNTYRVFKVIDFDQDGDEDVFVKPPNNWRNPAEQLPLLWYQNDGDGNFINPQPIEPFYEGNFVDLNGDDALDIFHLERTGGLGSLANLSWYQNDGFGNFNPVVAIDTFVAKPLFDELVVDLDNDGDLDFYNWESEKLIRYENDGKGNFSKHIDSLSSLFTDFQEAYTFDYDQDGDLDIAYLPYSLKPSMFENDGFGNFTEQENLPFLPASLSTGNAQFIDLDNDEDIDILFTTYTNSGKQIGRWYENDGQGHFSDIHILVGEFPLSSLRMIDLNGDKFTDFLWYEGGEGLVWYKNQIPDGKMSENFIFSYTPYQINSITVADLDNDAQEDIIVLGHDRSINGAKLYWYKNIENGKSFDRQLILEESSLPADIEAADFNNDGLVDLLATYQNIGGVVLYLNEGAPNFSKQTIFESGSSGIVKLVVKDIDRDGDIDFVTERGKTIYWYENDGVANFERHQIDNPNTYSPKYYDVADLDGDQDEDIILLDWKSSGVVLSWYENQGDATFGEPIRIGSHGFPGGVFARDLNNDEAIDLVVLGEVNKLYWYKNTGVGNFEAPKIIGPIEEFFYIVYDGFGDDGILFDDIDKDGDIDLFVNSYRNRGIWIENDAEHQLNTFHNIIEPNNYIRVAADLNNDGLTDFVSALSHRLIWYRNSLTTALSPLISNEQLQVFPNPFNQEFYFNLPSEVVKKDVRLQVFDAVGKLNYTEKLIFRETPVSIPNLAAGLYFYHIVDKEGQSIGSGKLIKQ